VLFWLFYYLSLSIDFLLRRSYDLENKAIRISVLGQMIPYKNEILRDKDVPETNL